MKRFLLSLGAALCMVTACSDGEGATGPGTPTVDVEVAQQLVAEIASEWMGSLTFAGLNSTLAGPHLGYGLQLAGVEEGLLGAATLFPGAPIGNFDPFCDTEPPGQEISPFWEGLDTCRRFSKFSETSYAVDVYFTVQPATLPDESHAFEYASTDPVGTVTYDPNPLVTWNHDFSGPDGGVLVTAELGASITYENEEGASLDLSHTGFAEATFADAGATGVLLVDLQFPDVPELCAETMTVVVFDENEDVSGSVTCGGDELATVTHDATGFIFTWND